MTRRRHVLAALGLTLCRTAAAAQPGSDPAAMGAQWATAWSAKDYAATLALYAPDAVFVQPTGEQVAGHDAIAALLRRVLAANNPRIAMSALCVAQAGAEAWNSGSFRETITPVSGGSPMRLQGHYLLLLRRAQGGAWLIARHVWSDK